MTTGKKTGRVKTVILAYERVTDFSQDFKQKSKDVNDRLLFFVFSRFSSIIIVFRLHCNNITRVAYTRAIVTMTCTNAVHTRPSTKDRASDLANHDDFCPTLTNVWHDERFTTTGRALISCVRSEGFAYSAAPEGQQQLSRDADAVISGKNASPCASVARFGSPSTMIMITMILNCINIMRQSREEVSADAHRATR
jgi:hypothetical protein